MTKFERTTIEIRKKIIKDLIIRILEEKSEDELDKSKTNIKNLLIKHKEHFDISLDEIDELIDL